MKKIIVFGASGDTGKYFVDYFAINGCFFKQPLVYIKKRASIKYLLQNCMKSI